MKLNQKKRNRILIIFIILALIFCTSSYAIHAYISDYYHANNTSTNEMKSDNLVSVKYINDNLVVFEPNEIKAGFIFYPGGKVEFTAYAPLLHELARNGILCLLPHMPANLAVFDANAADGLKDYYPDINIWYIGGHSLGGAMAASYAANNYSALDGLILLGSYSTKDLSDSNLNVICIYGSEDKVLNKEKYTSSLDNLPDSFSEYVIEGGCHAYFGSYGYQDGDGTPTITNNEQILTTVDYIISNLQ